MAIPTQKDKDQRYAPYAGGGGHLATTSRISAHIAKSTNQNIGNNSATVVTFSTTYWDDNTFWSASNPSRITFARAGKYEVRVQMVWDLNATAGNFFMYVIKGGDQTHFLAESEFAANNFTTTYGNHLSFIFDADANDYLEILVYQNIGSGNKALKGTATEFDSACRVWVNSL